MRPALGWAPSSTVLVIDSDIVTRCRLSSHLRECGYNVFEAKTALDAVVMLNTITHIDVVFANLDSLTGLQRHALAEWIKCERPSVKKIMASASMRRSEAVRDLPEPVSFLLKPYGMSDVERHIGQVLGRQ